MSQLPRPEVDSPPALEAPLLRVRGLRTYVNTPGGVVKAVDGVDLDIGAGASVGIVGESGSGKSMTALSIMRLIQKPAYIAGGTVSFKGTDLLGVPESKMRQARGRSISLVPQDSMSALNPVYTVGKQIVEAIRAHQRMSKSDAWKRGVQLLGMVGIPDPDERIKSYPHSMSGGMLQRVTIAMALAHEPELLILDEPTTALDVTIQAQILDLVRDLRARVNAAVLLITHDLGVVAESCDEVVVMYGGKVMEHSSTTAIMESPKHPYTVGLVASVPSLGTKGQQLRTIAGTVPNPLSMPPGCPFAPRCPHVMDKCATMPELRRMEDGRQIACWLD